MSIKFELVTEDHINEAVDLVIDAYYKEKEIIKFLPEEDYSKMFKKRIKDLFDNGSGVVAILNKKIVGFLAGFEINELWGKCKGIYCPLYGHGTIKGDRRKIYQLLYKKAAQIWVDKDITNHSITLYAQDKKIINTWFWMGFGIRCVDAIRETVPINLKKSKISIKKARLSDVSSLADIHGKHNLYYKKSPIFMPVHEEDPISDLNEC